MFKKFKQNFLYIKALKMLCLNFLNYLKEIFDSKAKMWKILIKVYLLVDTFLNTFFGVYNLKDFNNSILTLLWTWLFYNVGYLDWRVAPWGFAWPAPLITGTPVQDKNTNKGHYDNHIHCTTTLMFRNVQTKFIFKTSINHPPFFFKTIVLWMWTNFKIMTKRYLKLGGKKSALSYFFCV